MKKTLFLAVALLTFGIASAQITNGRIGTGTFIDYTGAEVPDLDGIDFNNDGTLEFVIYNNNYTNDYLQYVWTEGGNNIIASAEGWDYAAMLSQGSVVDVNGNFEGQGDAMINYTPGDPTLFYIGFRIVLADGVHYGWAQVEAESTPVSSDITLNWLACAYNATPGEPIAAGQTAGGVGIGTVEAPAFRAFALGQNSLRIEAGNNEVKVYDLGGRLVETVRGNATLTMPQGVYLLRAEGTTRKVLVY